MTSHPFISSTIATIQSEAIETEKLNAIYMIGIKGSGSIGDNEIKRINTVADFDTIVGSGAASKPSFRFLRKIDDLVPVYFVNGFSSNGTPTATDHLSAGILLLGQNVQLKPGIIIIPEASTLTKADNDTLFTQAQNLVSNPLMNWEYFHNLSTSANTKALAITEVTALTSAQGHSSAFWGYGKDADDNLIPLAVVAAGRETILNRTRTGYFSPSAFQESIPFKTVDSEYIPNWYIGTDEYTELKDKNLNTIFLDGDGLGSSSYKICGTRTLSTDVAWRHQNTRYAANNLFYRAAQVLKPYLFLPADIDAANTTEASIEENSVFNARVILSLETLLSQLNREGLFSNPPLLIDGSLPKKYTINPFRDSNGNLKITIECYIVQSRESITLSFIKRG